MCPENTGLRQAFSETVQRCGEALRHGFEPRLESLALDNRFDDRHVAMAYTGKTAILRDKDARRISTSTFSMAEAFRDRQQSEDPHHSLTR